MKILTTFFMLNLLINPVQADVSKALREVIDIVNKSTKSPDGVCHTCRTDGKKRKKHPLPVNNKDFNERCRSFIKSDGSYGPWGTTIATYINKSEARKNIFFSPALPGMQSAPQTCPNWGNMDHEEKSEFWVWMFASIAQIESSCDPNSVNRRGVERNNPPTGLLQLDVLSHKRKWRGPNCKFPAGIAATQKVGNNLNCGLDIMQELLKGKKGEYKTGGRIFPERSQYWEKLRSSHSPTGGPIGRLIRKYPGCKL